MIEVTDRNLFEKETLENCIRFQKTYELQLAGAASKNVPWMIPAWTRGLTMVKERISQLNGKNTDGGITINEKLSIDEH